MQANDNNNNQQNKSHLWAIENLWLPLLVTIIGGVFVFLITNTINEKNLNPSNSFETVSDSEPSTPEPSTTEPSASEPSTPEFFAPEFFAPEFSTPEPSAREPSAPLLIAPVGDYPTNYWEGDYVVGTLTSVKNSNPIQCILDGVLFTFSNEVGSFSLGHDGINIDNLLNLIGSKCRFNIDTAGYVMNVEVEFDFDGILTRIDYDENGNICGIQIDYYDGSSAMALTVPLELSKQLKNYLCVGNSYSVHFDIMGNISSVTST